MGSTPNYNLPYPELTDPADVPADMQELATATDTALGSVEDQIGTVSASPHARVHRNAALSHATSGQYIKVNWDTMTVDAGAPSAQFDDANDRLIARRDGIYICYATLAFGFNANGRRITMLRINGVDVAYGEVPPSSAAGSGISVPAMDVRRLVVGDYLEVAGYQNSGAALGYTVGAVSMFMGWVWVSP